MVFGYVERVIVYDKWVDRVVDLLEVFIYGVK